MSCCFDRGLPPYDANSFLVIVRQIGVCLEQYAHDGRRVPELFPSDELGLLHAIHGVKLGLVEALRPE